MSGWDEGAVYYSEQAQFPRGAGDPEQAASRHTFETAAAEALPSLRSRVSGESGEMEEPETEENVKVIPCRPGLGGAIVLHSCDHVPQDTRRQANENGETAAVPITVRQLKAIVRLSEALAKMQLSYVASDNYVMEAIRLFNNATMDIAKSGINQQINLTPEMANDIRRMGIASHISERRLIDELSRMGLDESIVRVYLVVRRALLIMHQRDEVEYERERRVILRKA
ncbi:hypothetical protein DCAR_0520502 [Daucus carota subsp. sativus]|uniref:DNA helicase n=1 Tax=Daucus carota subsp. sativus TaxID=79200 RepID=A0A164YKJ6_DAUCS|nr:hypothetical protein DCAR_0520502 [Daucus carota subsp. sativus]